MDTTDYYEKTARRKHPEPKQEWIKSVLADPAHTETQADGRIRYYGYIEEADKWLRVIIDNGKIHNCFFDSKKMRKWGRP